MMIIDEEALRGAKWEHLNTSWSRGWNSAVDAIIDLAETLDAVPVVRCKNCENWIQHDGWAHCYLDGRETTENDFCSWAERREDG